MSLLVLRPDNRRGACWALALAAAMAVVTPMAYHAAFGAILGPAPVPRTAETSGPAAPTSAVSFADAQAAAFDTRAIRRLLDRAAAETATARRAAAAVPRAREKRGPRRDLLAALQAQPDFIGVALPGDTPSQTQPLAPTQPLTEAPVPPPIDLVGSRLLPIPKSVAAPSSLPKTMDAIDGESRHIDLGLNPEAFHFDTGPGTITPAAGAGVWNGAPAAGLGLGYALPGGTRFKATGVTPVTGTSTLNNLPKSFGLSAAASIAFN